MSYSLETTLPILVALAASLLVGWLMLVTQRWHGHLSLDSEQGVQKFHTQATPRIGGLPVMVGLIGAWALLPAKARLLMAPLLLVLGAVNVKASAWACGWRAPLARALWPAC